MHRVLSVVWRCLTVTSVFLFVALADARSVNAQGARTELGYMQPLWNLRMDQCVLPIPVRGPLIPGVCLNGLDILFRSAKSNSVSIVITRREVDYDELTDITGVVVPPPYLWRATLHTDQAGGLYATLAPVARSVSSGTCPERFFSQLDLEIGLTRIFAARVCADGQAPPAQGRQPTAQDRSRVAVPPSAARPTRPSVVQEPPARLEVLSRSRDHHGNPYFAFVCGDAEAGGWVLLDAGTDWNGDGQVDCAEFFDGLFLFRFAPVFMAEHGLAEMPNVAWRGGQTFEVPMSSGSLTVADYRFQDDVCAAVIRGAEPDAWLRSQNEHTVLEVPIEDKAILARGKVLGQAIRAHFDNCPGEVLILGYGLNGLEAFLATVYARYTKGSKYTGASFDYPLSRSIAPTFYPYIQSHERGQPLQMPDMTNGRGQVAALVGSRFFIAERSTRVGGAGLVEDVFALMGSDFREKYRLFLANATRTAAGRSTPQTPAQPAAGVAEARNGSRTAPAGSKPQTPALPAGVREARGAYFPVVQRGCTEEPPLLRGDYCFAPVLAWMRANSIASLEAVGVSGRVALGQVLDRTIPGSPTTFIIKISARPDGTYVAETKPTFGARIPSMPGCTAIAGETIIFQVVSRQGLAQAQAFQRMRCGQ